MIWGETAKSREKDDARKQDLSRYSNERLQRWHNKFAWRKVELLDGRFARLCFVERKFVVSSRTHSSRTKTFLALVASGCLDLLECSKRPTQRIVSMYNLNDFGHFVYRESNSKDDVPSATEETPMVEHWVQISEAELEPETPSTSRREAIQEQRARKSSL